MNIHEKFVDVVNSAPREHVEAYDVSKKTNT